MNKPPVAIGIHFGREWLLRRPYVYRYLDKTHVDSFFERGALRIGSFELFSKHTDEARLDGSEGHGMVVNRNSEGEGSTVMGYMMLGASSYIFCGSSVFSDSVAEQFGTNSGFRINDTSAFADAVAHRIPGFRGGCEGHCIYVPSRMVPRDVGPVGIDQFKDDNDPIKTSMDKMMGFLGGMAGDDPLFLKESKYSSQCEYRFVWHTHDKKITGFLDIEVPEARQFCTRFEELEIVRHRNPSPEQKEEANKTAHSNPLPAPSLTAQGDYNPQPESEVRPR